jgi:hypothetical protein
MNLEDLRKLQEQAVQTALNSGRIEDVEKAANITKQLLDAEKSAKDAEVAPKLFRYEEPKSWATLLVPLLSILTLAVTVYMQSNQLQATREAEQDKQWLENVKNVLAQLDKKPQQVSDPAIASALLEPYAADKRFGTHARQLTIELLTRVPSAERFSDYFVSHHIGEQWSDVQLLTTVSREIFANLNEIELRLQKQPGNELLNAARDASVADLIFLTEKLSALYHLPDANPRAADFRHVLLIDGNLAKLDLADADLTGAKLQNVNLTDTVLGPGIKFQDVAFVDTHWWDAKEISKPLLSHLIENFYPYFNNADVQYATPPPDRVTYVKLVMQLCSKAGVPCQGDKLKYGEPPTPNEKVVGTSAQK